MSNKKGIIIALIVLIAAGAGGAWVYHNAQIEKMRTAGIEALNDSVSLEDYRDSEKREVEEILVASEEKINACDEQEDIDAINKEAVEQISEIKTAVQLDKEEAIEKLKESVSLDDYRDKQKKTVKKIIKETEEAVNNASDEEEINKIIEEATAEIAEVKTDAQLTAEEEAAASKASSGSSSKKSSNSQGCVGGGSKNFY